MFGIIESYQINSLQKDARCVLHFTGSRKSTQFGLFSPEFEIGHIFVSVVLRPAAATMTKQLSPRLRGEREQKETRASVKNRCVARMTSALLSKKQKRKPRQASR